MLNIRDGAEGIETNFFSRSSVFQNPCVKLSLISINKSKQTKVKDKFRAKIKQIIKEKTTEEIKAEFN